MHLSTPALKTKNAHIFLKLFSSNIVPSGPERGGYSGEALHNRPAKEEGKKTASKRNHTETAAIWSRGKVGKDLWTEFGG